MHIAVIGRGLIGSAAAKYLARAGHDVTLIGPDGPDDKAAHTGVFASHYDEGRITRSLDATPYWSRVSAASIARYAGIERDSGVAFFTDCGALMAGPATTGMMPRITAVMQDDRLQARRLTGAALADAFPYLAFGPGTLALHEQQGAGHISPRSLVRAQGVLAQQAGASVVRAEASGIGVDGTGVAVATSAGPVRADRVLIAAGGFTNLLLDDPLPVTVYARTVAFFELDEGQAARLDSMPSVVMENADGRDSYLLPPIRYPDGRIYLKLGGDPEDVALPDIAAIKAWFRTDGSAKVGAALRAQITNLMPDLDIAAMHTRSCVTTYTPEDRPAIRHLDARRAVAFAGCGRGAKCSDELGRIAAGLFD